MAMAVSTFHLAVIGLALLHLLARATTAENLLVRSHTTTTTTIPFPPCSSAFPLGSDAPPTAAGWPASSHHRWAPSPSTLPDATAPHSLGVSTIAPQDATAAAHAAAVVSGLNLRDPVFFDRRHAPPPSTTLSDDSSPRSHGALAVECQGQDTTASLGASPPAPRCPGGRAINTRAAAVDDVIEAALQRGAAVSATTPATKALLYALPLLTIPFLPPPVAALAALSSLATPVRARSDDCFKLNHATCTIYPYDNETDSIDRTRPNPDLDLGAVCLHPLCHADSAERLFSVLHGQRHGRGGDILYIYCTVRTLEGPLSIVPWGNNWRVHLPVADPGAAAASGGEICYVELEHLEYREGYYIHCPVGEHRQTYCTEFPDEAIAAAVWEHRRLNYRDTVGPRYATYQPKYKYDEL